MTPAQQSAHDVQFGWEEGKQCWRDGCAGLICTAPSENCSCHLHPPCGSCTSPRNYCPVCGWQEKDDQGAINDMSVKYDSTKSVITDWKPRPLDPRKLDYRNLYHTHFSMIKEGIYPIGMTQAEVEKEVRGTFGGRFQYFGNGKFSYVAYTD